MITHLLLGVVIGMIAAGIATYRYCQKQTQRRRIDDIQMLRGQLFEVSKWNAYEFPQVGDTIDEINIQLQYWLHEAEKDSVYAYPSVRHGSWYREYLRTKFGKPVEKA